MDDNQWAADGTYSIPAGDHQFVAIDNGAGAFAGFFDGSNWYGNYANITISQDTTITAYYNYIPTYTITFYASDPSSNPISTDVYINNNWVGNHRSEYWHFNRSLCLLV